MIDNENCRMSGAPIHLLSISILDLFVTFVMAQND